MPLPLAKGTLQMEWGLEIIQAGPTVTELLLGGRQRADVTEDTV
jgi:hypothetical protein